ncbi:AsmA family protein [Shimia sp. CNT1-13L.2]|uniref:AsmA family protein n=1 Tax=Shimia sp. CNT1-13L.2 TaxID=2959663 RepID=UPI0020CD5087|nr:AsmA family protein [Shimia sp. CNT1-13L.2]MCP9480369.1 AsmA family protein [Shimia sp. CNT1-13L.2]
MRLIRILLMVVVVVVLGLVALVVLLPGEKIAKIAADQVKAQTGRELSFDGKVGLSWYPVLGVSTGAVTLGNADWSDAGPMFRAESAAIGVDAMSLIGGDIRITKIEAVRPEVLLEVAKDGRANWELFPESDAATETSASGESGLGGLVLESLNIRDAKLRYVDHGGESFEISDVDAALRWLGKGKPAEVDLTLRPAGDEVSLNAVVSDLEGLLGGAVTNVQAKVRAAGASVDFDGRAALDPQVAGMLDANVPDPDALMTALGRAPSGVAGPAAVKGEITLTKEGQFSLRNGSITAFGNSLTAQADVFTSGPRPVVNAQFSAGGLNLVPLMGSGGESAPSAARWSKDPIDASALGLIDGEIGLSAESIDLGSAKLGKTRAIVAIKNSRAVVTLREAHIYDGVASGKVVANNRKGFSARADVSIAGLELQKLLSETAGVTRLSGKGKADISVLASGKSMHALMNSLDGSGSVDVGQGKISGIDLDRLLRGQPGGGTTVFDALSGSFVIKKGILSNDDLLLSLPSVIAKGAGTVGIGLRNIDYLFTPQLRSETDDGLAVPVEIKGSWDNPQFIPRLDKALGRDVDLEIDKVTDKAKSEVKQKLEEKLGVQSGEEQSVEDALKQKLEDKAVDKLKNLLGGN